MPNNPRILPIDEVVAEYNAGATAAELGLKYDVAPSTITRRLKDAGLTIRPQRRAVATPPIEEIIARHNAGQSQTQIAAWAGVSKQTISDRLRDAGIGRRPTQAEIDLARRAYVREQIRLSYGSGSGSAA